MYIGPWQEYSLAKQQQVTKPRNAPVIPNSLKADIERALAKSLDPISAQIALSSISSSFNRNSERIKIENERKGPFEDLERFRPRNPAFKLEESPRRNKADMSYAENSPTFSVNSRTKKIHDALMTNQRQPQSARNGRDFPSPAPVSVRSTQSEPNPSSYLPRIPNKPKPVSVKVRKTPRRNHGVSGLALDKLPNIFDSSSNNGHGSYNSTTGIHAPISDNEKEGSSYHVSHTKSSYNTHHVVGLLKVERNARAKDKISTITGWNKTMKDNSNKVDDSLAELIADMKPGGEPVKEPAILSTEQRLTQVKHMKDMYSQSQNTINNSNKNSIAISSSGVNVPKIEEMSLDDQELMAISKYFTSSPSSGGFKENPVNNHNNTYSNRKSKSNLQKPMKRFDDSANFDDDDSADGLDAGCGGASKPTVGSPFGPFGTPMSQKGGIGFMDEGLLDWTSQLDYDNL